MATTSPNMSLVEWTAVNDLFNHTQLAANFAAIDVHDHTGAPSKGLKIPTSGIANLAITTALLANDAVTTTKILDLTVTSAKLAAGAVTPSKVGVLPQARVYGSIDSAITSGAATILSFNTERYDSDTIHDLATNPSRLTCRTAGTYFITGSVRWQANATGWRRLSLKVNGSTYIAQQRNSNAGGSDTVEQTISTAYRLAVNDYVELEVLHNAGSAVNVVSVSALSPEFGMSFISATP